MAPRSYRGQKGKVFVGGISLDLEDSQLKSMFEKFGEIIDWIVIRDKQSKRSRGFGFVTFSSPKDAEAAIKEMNEKEVDGKPLHVVAAVAKDEPGGFDSEQRTSPHGRDGHGYRGDYPRSRYDRERMDRYDRPPARDFYDRERDYDYDQRRDAHQPHHDFPPPRHGHDRPPPGRDFYDSRGTPSRHDYSNGHRDRGLDARDLSRGIDRRDRREYSPRRGFDDREPPRGYERREERYLNRDTGSHGSRFGERPPRDFQSHHVPSRSGYEEHRRGQLPLSSDYEECRREPLPPSSGYEERRGGPLPPPTGYEERRGEPLHPASGYEERQRGAPPPQSGFEGHQKGSLSPSGYEEHHRAPPHGFQERLPVGQEYESHGLPAAGYDSHSVQDGRNFSSRTAPHDYPPSCEAPRFGRGGLRAPDYEPDHEQLPLRSFQGEGLSRQPYPSASGSPDAYPRSRDNFGPPSPQDYRQSMPQHGGYESRVVGTPASSLPPRDCGSSPHDAPPRTQSNYGPSTSGYSRAAPTDELHRPYDDHRFSSPQTRSYRSQPETSTHRRAGPSYGGHSAGEYASDYSRGYSGPRGQEQFHGDYRRP